ncbi:MAG TPA: GDCCVxC domain-containing (seleno)protein [Chitinophagales bacterium]|nr:GDCCVxC domain-containing (seleno)protein [Chitinophagales bacterium]
MKITTVCVIKCPHCKVEQQASMPENSCQLTYDCSACGKEMVKAEGDCCVFCSYGSLKCPSKQMI